MRTKITMSLTIKPRLKEALKDLAIKKEMSTSGFICYIIEEYLKDEQPIFNKPIRRASRA
jgi:hypothetical protein